MLQAKPESPLFVTHVTCEFTVPDNWFCVLKGWQRLVNVFTASLYVQALFSSVLVLSLAGLLLWVLCLWST